MTSKNLNWMNEPFLLEPAGKDYLWGGERLKTEFGKKLHMRPLAETWECSTHPDGPSIVSGGLHDQKTLTKVLQEHPEYLGTHPRTSRELPILVKLIDAAGNLSVQVHPDDDYAREHENGSLGKTEMWYVLDAKPGTKLVYGFRHDMTRERIRESLQGGTIERHLQKVPVQKDDVFYIEAGTVHAIGAGALIAEIQENSNLTYRLYDYQRVDKNGKPRQLHVEKALDVVRLQGSQEPRQPMRVLRYSRGCALELLCRCRYFQVERLLLNVTEEIPPVEMQTQGNSFQVLLCVDGSGVLSWTRGEIAFRRGDCIFLPADSVPMELCGRAQLLRVGC
ncbi:MAG: class I mannose-6-phosphate isomerase [Candidatus Gastranaerophilales bacterium]|nr:class I mannose-6-phosphate isomerase [Candidatus Gastranaerophilales bacterium]